MDSSTRFLSKMSKVENLLLIVNNEVDSAVQLLHHLKEHSLEMVEALKKITSSSVFLKEFLEINSFLLKFLDFLTEINCKFEILQNSDSEANKLENIRNSTPTLGARLKSLSKSELDVNLKDNSVVSTLLPENVALDYLSDISNSSSSDISCAEKVAVKNKTKKSHKIQKQRQKTVETKKDTSNRNCQPSDSCLDDKQIVCDEVQIRAPNSAVNEIVKEINGNIIPLCSLTEKEEENFGQESSISQFCTLEKEPVDKNGFGKVESETLPPTIEVPVGEICTEVSSSKCNVKVEPVKDSNSCLSNNGSHGFIHIEHLEGCNDKLYEIKSINISRKVGEEYKVILEHIVSPSEFYVYILQSHLYSFKELEKKLMLIQKDSSCHKKKESKEYLSQVIGKYALYYSKCDEKWCRAKITDWRVNFKDDLVYIFLVDYGESKCVTLDDIQPMPDTFKLYPAFIQRCHLSGIHPTEVNLFSKTLAWSKAASEKMKCLVDTSESLKIKVAPEDTYHPAKSLPVTLWLIDKDNECVNDLLVKSQHAQVARNPEALTSSISESENLEKWNPMKEDFESYLNSYDLDMQDPAAVIYGYVGTDYDRICKHFAKTGKCFKGQSCKKEHVPLNPAGFTTDKEEVYKNAVNALTLPQPKSFVSVQVTCILSVNLFCCIRDESAWTCEEETLLSLVQYMNSKENIRDMKKLLIPPSVGQLVIAKYSQDSSWYRGKIIESQPESDEYGVLFVDYGNKEVMPLSCIRAIEGRYLHLPFQAMQCCIFGIAQNSKVPVKEGMDYLNKKITGHVNIEVVATFPGDHPRLLVHVFDQDGKNIGTDLITKEYAVIKQELIVNSESTSIPG